jgi:hypothetical protein
MARLLRISLSLCDSHHTCKSPITLASWGPRSALNRNEGICIRSDCSFAILFSDPLALLLRRRSRGRVVHDRQCQLGRRRPGIVCGEGSGESGDGSRITSGNLEPPEWLWGSESIREIKFWGKRGRGKSERNWVALIGPDNNSHGSRPRILADFVLCFGH